MDILRQYWPQLIALVALTIWVGRLESLAKFTAREIKRLDHQRAEDLLAAKEARASTNAKLDRMDDKMDKAFAEFRGDIKILIRQGASK